MEYDFKNNTPGKIGIRNGRCGKMAPENSYCRSSVGTVTSGMLSMKALTLRTAVGNIDPWISEYENPRNSKSGNIDLKNRDPGIVYQEH